MYLVIGILLLMLAASLATMGLMYLFRDDVRRLDHEKMVRYAKEDVQQTMSIFDGGPAMKLGDEQQAIYDMELPDGTKRKVYRTGPYAWVAAQDGSWLEGVRPHPTSWRYDGYTEWCPGCGLPYNEDGFTQIGCHKDQIEDDTTDTTWCADTRRWFPGYVQPRQGVIEPANDLSRMPPSPLIFACSDCDASPGQRCATLEGDHPRAIGYHPARYRAAGYPEDD